MRLGIDAREIQNGVYTGIGRPLADFLHYFASFNNDDRCVLFSAKKVPIDFGPRVTNVVIKEYITLLWDQWQLPQKLKAQDIDIFYSPYYKIPLMKPCITVSAILDLMYLRFSPYYAQMPVWAKAYYAVFGKAFALRADGILTCSQFSKKDIVNTYGIDPCKIEVVPLSLSGIFRRELGPRITKGRYVLYLGNFKLHKNIKVLIEAFALIAPEFPDLNLVLAGPKQHTFNDLAALVNRLRLHERVIFPGKINDADKPQVLYSQAEAFIMPSLYEGFGLPPLEAMACGVPVIASNTTSIPEAVKDAGISVDPTDIQAIAQAMRSVLTDGHLRQELIAKGLHRVKEYDAKDICARMYGIFKEGMHV